MEGRKRASWRQSTKGAAEPGEDERIRGGAGGETPGGVSLPLTPPQKVQWAGCGVASAPLTKTVHFRLVSGTHFLFHLSDLIMPPCNFRLGLLCLPFPHFSLWPQSSFFFLANNIWSAGRVDCIKVKDLPLRSNIYSYRYASLFIFINLI